MLLLTRKPGESLIVELGEGMPPIEITVIESGAQTRLGVDAPAQCKIWRKELYQTIQANRQAAGVTEQGSIRALARSLAQTLHAEKKPAEAGGQITQSTNKNEAEGN